MNLRFNITNEEKGYTIGYSKELDGYILCIPIDGMDECNRYYEISLDEYELNETEEFDAFIQSIANEGLESTRFLFSDKEEENDSSQNKLKENYEKKMIEKRPEYQENNRRKIELGTFGLLAILVSIPSTREIGIGLMVIHTIRTLLHRNEQE